MQKRFLILALMPLSSAFGQLDSNSITVTASRNIASAQPDQAIFGVQVNSGLDTSLDDVIAALQGTGITIANVTGLNSYFLVDAVIGTPVVVLPPQGLIWLFRFAAPLTKMKDTVTTLRALQQSITEKDPGLTLSFSVQGTQSSGQPQQTCSIPDLLSDARAQAQNLANGAGFSVGNILAISNPTASGPASVATLASVLLGPSGSPICTMTVTFALLRF